MNHITNFGSFKVFELSNEEFNPLWEPLAKEVFDDEHLMFNWRKLLSDVEKEKLKGLREKFKAREFLNLVVYDDERIIAWSRGYQETQEQFYVMNSAVLPEYRRKGLYTKLIGLLRSKVQEMGFQKIRSNHLLTNNPVIIAKLKEGFRIVGLEVSDTMGVLLSLVYYMKPLSNEVMDFRAGMKKPSEELKKILEI